MNKITLVVLVFLFSISSFSQFSEDFESANAPNPLPSTVWTLNSGNWAIHDNGIGPVKRWERTDVISNVHSGLYSAYINRENIGFGYTSEDYLTSPTVSVPANGHLTFVSRTTISGNQGTLYQVKVAPANGSQTDLSNATILAIYTENDISNNYDGYEEKTIDLSAYAGQNIYITFVRIYNQPTAALGGDRWLIDNVNVNSANSCTTPINVTTSGVNYPNATISWTETGSATQWEIIVLPAGTYPTTSSVGTIVNTNPATITNLTNSSNNVYVRAICSPILKSNWSTMANTICPKPINLNNSNVTHQSATVAWTSNSSATLWEVIALPCTAPAPVNNITVGVITTTNPFVINGLNPNTCYQVYVKAICSANDSSDWSAPTSFITMLAPLECGDLFVDNGGSNANYLNNSNNYYTICPTYPGEMVTVTFTSFDTAANWDGLFVFDGNSFNSPQIASTNGVGLGSLSNLTGGFWGTTIPGPFTSSDPSGCLSFRFISSGSTTRPGWSADITCENLDKIILVAFNDYNNNGVKDSGENYFTNGSFVYQQNNTGPITNTFSSNGRQTVFDSNPANTYDFSYNI
ncbi:choice-of-anchor J domain-containing protein [Flavobacterium sp.]|uniref:choice-of-anchor J domain-containing protein n=1 Tax=Flavobacterium sp. TaxID=239 RepID=UPI0026350102|nr:choice-of-anchor J domain-containing protein [Flavobacterium sp.]